jgi:general secretion pathway protein I
MNRTRGFTLLEVLVATVIMAVAVTGLLSSLATALRNSSKLMDADRTVALARQKMDELILDSRLPLNAPVEGSWDPAYTGGQPAGWRAQVQVFETAPEAPPGSPRLERIDLQVWLGPENSRRNFSLEAYRTGRVPMSVAGQR